MKKILFVLPVALLALAGCEKKEVHLICKTGIETSPSTDSNVKESYDINVKFLDDGALLTVDGVEYELEQDYDDARVSYHRFDPWYNLQIGNRQFSTKYSVGIPSDEGAARYTACEEVD